MIIRRELKHATWEYNDDERFFTLKTINGKIVIDRVYAFSLARFLLRGIYRMTMKRLKVPYGTSKSSSETLNTSHIKPQPQLQQTHQ